MEKSIERIEELFADMQKNLEVVKSGKRWKLAAKRVRKMSLDLTQKMKNFRKLSVQKENE